MPDLHLDSKTVLGFITMIAVVIFLLLFDKLTPEAVDILKYIFTSYFAVRTAANITENLGGKS